MKPQASKQKREIRKLQEQFLYLQKTTKIRGDQKKSPQFIKRFLSLKITNKE